MKGRPKGRTSKWKLKAQLIQEARAKLSKIGQYLPHPLRHLAGHELAEFLSAKRAKDLAGGLLIYPGFSKIQQGSQG